MPDAVYTHGHHESVLRSHRNRGLDNSAAYLMAYIKPGQSLLDVGCGPGTITAEFAEWLAPGTVTAAEHTQNALALAQAEMDKRAITGVEWVVTDVHALDFDDDSFDIVHAHQVLQHVGDPVLALREMRRVCKPGGIVAARDADYAAFAWYPQWAELDEWMRDYQWAAYANGGEPNAGRRLLSWAQKAGFEAIIPSASTWCLATPQDRTWWGGMWAERILHSAIAEQLRAADMAKQQDLERISKAWREWSATPDGWFTLLHGEIVCRA